jgi:hypothetical protein
MTNVSNKKFDYFYPINHPTLREILSKINERGHYIGIHPSYNTSIKIDLLKTEVENLQKVLKELKIYPEKIHSRMHFLRWKWPLTAYGLEGAKCYYDSTLGYADKPGFRCGTCFSYRMFDPLEKKILNLIEKPLIVMESSIFSTKYMNIKNRDEAYNRIIELRNECQKVNGSFRFLWHNTNLRLEEDRSLYKSLLSYK